jgi:hypothetical protein
VTDARQPVQLIRFFVALAGKARAEAALPLQDGSLLYRFREGARRIEVIHSPWRKPGGKTVARSDGCFFVRGPAGKTARDRLRLLADLEGEFPLSLDLLSVWQDCDLPVVLTADFARLHLRRFLLAGRTAWGPFLFAGCDARRKDAVSLVFAGPAGEVVFGVQRAHAALGDDWHSVGPLALRIEKDGREPGAAQTFGHRVEDYLYYACHRSLRPGQQLAGAPAKSAEPVVHRDEEVVQPATRSKERRESGTSRRILGGWIRRPRLRIVAAGTGRDGTMTMARLIGDLAAANGTRLVAVHELYANHVCNLLCGWYETGRYGYRLALEELLAHVPAHAVAGTTYQFALDILADKYGRGLKLIHLQRRDKRAYIRSLERIIHFRPATAVNMTTEACRPQHRDYTTRLAAFHLGDMSRSDWEALPLERRLDWHYEKTHALLDAARQSFDAYLKVYTEDLNRPATLRRLARFIDPTWRKACAPVRLNTRETWEENAESYEKVRRETLAELPDAGRPAK